VFSPSGVERFSRAAPGAWIDFATPQLHGCRHDTFLRYSGDMATSTLAALFPLLILIGIGVYFIPTFCGRKKTNAAAIFLLNLDLMRTSVSHASTPLEMGSRSFSGNKSASCVVFDGYWRGGTLVLKPIAMLRPCSESPGTRFSTRAQLHRNPKYLLPKAPLMLLCVV
jgi:hypothetical protein